MAASLLSSSSNAARRERLLVAVGMAAAQLPLRGANREWMFVCSLYRFGSLKLSWMLRERIKGWNYPMSDNNFLLFPRKDRS